MNRVVKSYYPKLTFGYFFKLEVVMQSDNKERFSNRVNDYVKYRPGYPAEIFLKIHKSTIVNINKIKSIEGNEINMGKAKVVISQTLQDGIMKDILKDRMMKR